MLAPPASLTLPPAAPVSGYWLAAIPGKGFGIVRATGPLQGTAHARFLGSTPAQMTAAIHPAVASLHAEQVYEVAGGVPTMIEQAVHHGSAWASGPASVSWDTLPTKILVGVVTAGAGLALFGAGAGAGAAIGEAGAEAGAEAGGGAGAAAAGGAAGGGAVTAGKAAIGKVAGGIGKTIAKNPLEAAGALSIAGLFTNVSWWKGGSMVLAGGVLVILAVRELT